MGFYQAMQLSAANLKPLIKNAESKEIKNKYSLLALFRIWNVI